MATNYNKTWQKITHFAIRTRVEDALLVGTLLLHPVLPHSLLPTLATRNEREVRPQSLRDPMRGRGLRSSCHLRLSILIFINYYKFLILWTMKLNELYTKKTLYFSISKPSWKWGNERCILVLMSYYKLPSSSYSNYQVSLSSNGV